MLRVRRTVSVDAAYRALGRFVVRFRWPIVAFWILAAIVTSAALPSLASRNGVHWVRASGDPGG